jgi:transcriptional regulator with XRE-family HTH domain
MNRNARARAPSLLGRNLVVLLERRGWTQRQLAAASGVPYPTINFWTAGVARVDLDNLRRVAAALEVPVYQLAFGLDRRDPYEGLSIQSAEIGRGEQCCQ